jgi:hypothetical protein
MQQVILSIKRTVDTIDGQIINYLQREPFDLGSLPEIVMLTLKQYWSPFAISAEGVDGEQLRQRAIWSIKQLEAQAALIREVFLESQVKTSVVENSTRPSDIAENVSSTNDEQTRDEEDYGLIDIEIPEDLKQVYKLFGAE